MFEQVLSSSSRQKLPRITNFRLWDLRLLRPSLENDGDWPVHYDFIYEVENFWGRRSRFYITMDEVST